jgi:hypothetical protein
LGLNQALSSTGYDVIYGSKHNILCLRTHYGNGSEHIIIMFRNTLSLTGRCISDGHCISGGHCINDLETVAEGLVGSWGVASIRG